MSRWPLVGSAVLLLLLAGCSSPAPEPPADALECLDVAEGVGARIADGATTVPMSPVELAAVEAPALKDAYLVAMSFSAEGGDDAIGVWATTSLADESMSVMAVDGYAASFTNWPNVVDGQELDASEPGAEDAIACLG